MQKTMDYLFGNTSSFTPASKLLSYPSLLKGIARSIDVWGNLDEYSYSSSENEADRDSLKRDYYLVMCDITKAQQQHERKQ